MGTTKVSRILLPHFLLVWIALVLMPIDKTSAAETSSGYESMFNGRTLKGWTVMPASARETWQAKDGMIVGDGDQGRSYLSYDKKDIADFEMKFRYRFPGKGNSGVNIRAVEDETGKRDFKSYHADLGHVGIGKQILGAWDFHTPGRIEHGCLRGHRLVIDKNDNATFTAIEGGLTLKDIRQGDWNDVHIIAKGNRFTFLINGKLSAEFIENLEKKRRLDRGMIQLQLHDPGMIVQFKDLQIKLLR